MRTRHVVLWVIAAIACTAQSPWLSSSGSALAAAPTSVWANVRDYGATGDGVTDDRAAIQAALDDAAGRVVYFPIGTYRAAQNGTHYWCLIVRPGTTLLGESRTGSIVQQAPGAGPSVQLFQVEAAPDVTFRNLTLDGLRDQQVDLNPHRAGIFVKQSPRFVMRHVTSQNFTGDGVEIYDQSNDSEGYDILMQGNARNGLTLGGGTTGGSFVASRFLSNGAQQFDSEGGSPISNVTLTGNLFDALGASNDYVLTMTGGGADKRSTGWTVTHNVVNGAALVLWNTDLVYAFNVGVNPSSKPSLYIYRSADRIDVHHNALTMTGLPAFDAGAIVYVIGTNPGQSPGGVSIRHNILTSTVPAYGITAMCVRELAIEDNAITGSGGTGSGVFVRVTKADEPVKEVLVYRNTVTGFGRWGVWLGGNGLAQIWKVEIANNTFTDVQTALNLNDGTNAARDVTAYGNTVWGGTLLIHPPAGVSQVWGDGTRWIQ